MGDPIGLRRGALLEKAVDKALGNVLKSVPAAAQSALGDENGVGSKLHAELNMDSKIDGILKDLLPAVQQDLKEETASIFAENEV